MKYMVVKLCDDKVENFRAVVHPGKRGQEMVVQYDTPFYPSTGLPADREFRESQLQQQPWFSFNTEKEAEGMASYLAGKHPGSAYVVCKVQSRFACPPGEATKTVFTDKGALPA